MTNEDKYIRFLESIKNKSEYQFKGDSWVTINWVIRMLTILKVAKENNVELQDAYFKFGVDETELETKNSN